MLYVSVGSTNKKCAACATSIFQRLGCKRPRGKIAYSTLLLPFKETAPPSRCASVISHEMVLGIRQGRPLHNFGNTTTNNYSRQLSTNSDSGSSFRLPPLQQPNLEFQRNEAIQFLSQRLAFFLSDIHLRHDRHLRSILRQHENQYLPLNSIKSLVPKRETSIQKFTTDPSVMQEAVDILRGKSPIRLDIIEGHDSRGELFVKRSPPFDYAESVHNSHRKMMVVDGWPKRNMPRWAKSLVRSLLCSDLNSIGGHDNSAAGLAPVAYWRYDHTHDVLNIEFESEEDAMGAWNNLERAASSQVDLETDSLLEAVSYKQKKPGHNIAVQPLHAENENNSYQIKVGDLSLVARPIGLSMIEEGGVLEKETVMSGGAFGAVAPSQTQQHSPKSEVYSSEGNTTQQDLSNIVEVSLAEPEIVKSERGFGSVASLNQQHQHLSEPEVNSERNRTVQDLSKRLSFFLSDIHLRHNEYVRSILQEHENQCLPLNSIASFGQFTGDPSIALDAAKLSNSTSLLGQSPVQLDIEEANTGELLVRRTPPFDYTKSVRDSLRKMMVVDGWPKGPKPRSVKELVRSLLCNDVASVGNSEIPVEYWRFDNSKGVLKIEFYSEEGAMGAWDNLERATSRVDCSSGQEVAVQLLESDHEKRSYQLRIGDFSLVARSIDTSTIVKSSLPESEMMKLERNTAETDSVTSADASNKYGSYMKWKEEETPSLRQFVHAMNHLYNDHVDLPPPSREWLHEYVRPTKTQMRQRNTEGDGEEMQPMLARRHHICREVANVVSRVKASIDQGKIRALGGKDGYALSDSLGKAMMIYSETPSSFSDKVDEDSSDGTAATSPYEACLDVFDILRSLNLDIHPSHFSYSIRAACHESRWEEAANLFLAQIDGDDAGDTSFMTSRGGFVPIDPAIGWDQPCAIGLYAVARKYKQIMADEGLRENDVAVSPSKRVFDAAMKMCMLSPSGQENYILAAGSALGRAGLWNDCLDFATDSSSMSSYGPSIAAASILACIESSRSSEAISAYNFFMSDSQSAASVEWQWEGGNITALKPLCRDLALHAMGNAKKGGFGRDAMQMFGEIIGEDSPVSANALVGLAHSLENDGDWSSSIHLLKSFLDSAYHSTKWRILPDAMELNKSDGGSIGNALTQSERNNLLASILASVMRVCNDEGKYGVANLFCSIANNSYANEQSRAGHHLIDCQDDNTMNAMLSQQIVGENHHVLEAYIHSLYGLGYGRIVNRLLKDSQNSNINISMPRGLRKTGLPHVESWTNAFVAINRVLTAMDAIRSEDTNIPPESRLLFERGLGRAMDHCIDAKQPAAALHLFDHTTALLTRKNLTLAQTVKSFFGMENPSDERTREVMFRNDNAREDLKSLRPSDPVLAALIRAYHKTNQPENALSAFYDGTMHLDDSSTMAMSQNANLEVLLDNDVDECISFLDNMDEGCVNPSTFLIIAKHYARNEIWPQVGELYNRARKAGCISEELGLIAMQAVCESELLEGKILVLRAIVWDISNLNGMTPDEYIQSKYWGIKRYVGFHYARLLMRWNTPATSQKEELLFAINEMRQCAKEGISAKNGPLECIVRIAHVYDSDGTIESNLPEKQRRSAVNLILEACVQADKSGLMTKQTFTTQVVRSLRALKANKECIEVVLTLISKGGKCKHRVAMEQAIYAALEERDSESLKLITDVFERSGYDPNRLSAQ